MAEFNDIAVDSAKGGLFLFTGNVLYTLISALGTIIIARLLGPEIFGLYSLLLVAPSIMAIFTFTGINPALTRYSAKLRAKRDYPALSRMIVNGFKFIIFIAFAAFIITLLLSNYLATFLVNRPELTNLIKIASIIIIPKTLLRSLRSVFIGFDRMEYNAYIRTIQAGFKAITSPILIIIGFGIFGALVGHISGFIAASAFGLFILYQKCYRPIKAESSYSEPILKDLKIMIQFGLPISLSLMHLELVIQFYKILLAFFASNVEIGNFMVAFNYIALINLLTLPLKQVLFPAFTKIKTTKSLSDLKRALKFAINYTSLLVVPTSMFTILLSRELVNTIFGSSYNLAPQYLSLYLISFLYTGIGYSVLPSFFNGIGESKKTLNTTLITLIILAPLAPVLTWWYRVPGLITSILLSNLGGTLYAFIVANKMLTLNINIKKILRIYAASLLSAIPVYILLPFLSYRGVINIFFGAIIFLILYITLIPILQAINKSDIQNLKNIFKQIRGIWPFMKIFLQYEEYIIVSKSKFTF